ncbi:hypothetical protein GCM10023339_16890 [Alloalcanivorax gelatiniphagus]
MTAGALHEGTPVVGVLVAAADDFAARARVQEERRDRARPGTSGHHVYAHSATLWREAETTLRRRIAELQVDG